MRLPNTLDALLEEGILEEVIRPLMSGKEAQVYLVISEGEQRVAKVYKEAQNRTFKNRAEYTEGRRVRNSRDQRAMAKRTKHGRAKDEAAWRSTEVDMIYRLKSAGVRVPTPYHYIDGVLVMELVRGPGNHPAPRLGDLTFSPAEATEIFHRLLREVVRMLCAGVVHGDLSDFNVLMDAQGPVIIDFPQAVTAAGNQNARKLLLRDVANLQNFLRRFAPNHPNLPYAQEMWHLYENGELTPTTELTGKHAASTRQADAGEVLSLIDDARYDERRRRESLGRGFRDGGPAHKVEVTYRSPDGARPATAPARGPQSAGPSPKRHHGSLPRQPGSGAQVPQSAGPSPKRHHGSPPRPPGSGAQVPSRSLGNRPPGDGASGPNDSTPRPRRRRRRRRSPQPT